jgi:hypothetical protein
VIATLALVSWIFWLSWMAVGLVYELFAVFTEKKNGSLPLTRVVRDRLMRRSAFAKFGVLLFLTWLWIHFVTPLNW